MPENKQKKTYWPHMILGFLMVGITLGYWTVKSATSMPVQESNDFMMKYQQADLNYNEIIKKKQAFDKKYQIKLTGAETMVMTDNVNSNRPQPNPVKLHQGKNSFTYLVTRHDGSGVEDANVTFELTRPHTRKDDQIFVNVPGNAGRYTVKDVTITKPGRYTLLLRAKIDENTVGYSKIPAYLKP